MHIFWQMIASNALMVAALAFAVVMLSRAWRNPAGLHFLWVLLLVKLLTPPLVTIPLPIELAASTAPRGIETRTALEPSSSVVSHLPHQQPAVSHIRETPGSVPRLDTFSDPKTRQLSDYVWGQWSTLLVWIWLVGSAAAAGRYGFHIIRFQRLLRNSQLPSPTLLEMASTVSQRLGLKHTPEVRLVDRHISPLVWSLGMCPRIYLPAELFTRLAPRAQQTILAHEIAHICRRDHLVRLLELAVTTLFWWHPAVWWARRELRELEEQCCDAMVLQVDPNAVKAYATALIETLDFLAKETSIASIGATSITAAGSLTRRIHMLKHASAATRLGFVQLTLLMALAAVPLTTTFAAPLPDNHETQLAAALATTADEPAPATAEAPEPAAAKSEEAMLLQEPIVGRNFVIIPVTTNLQRAYGAKYKDAKIFVLINGAALVNRDETTLNVDAVDLRGLREALLKLHQAGMRGTAVLRVELPEFDTSSLDFDSASRVFVSYLRAESKGWLMKPRVEAVGHHDWKYAGRWNELVASLSLMPTAEQIRAEEGIGDDQVTAYPIQTPLSRYLYGDELDGILHVIPPIDQAKPDLNERAQRAVAALKLPRSRVTFLYYWSKGDIGRVNAVAKELFHAPGWKTVPGFDYWGQHLWSDEN